jgi:hypothetical protein
MTDTEADTDTEVESADLFKSLRASTARMMSYDIEALSPLHALRLDMVCSLRLETTECRRASFVASRVTCVL